MSQHDFNIANQSFPATRTDLNNALVALASNSSGDAEPATKYANQWWYETDTNTLKLRNEANDAWISIAVLDQSGNAVQSITTAGLTLGSTAISATGTEINQLDAITRGSILYGNASGATARLAKGGANTVLTSDGTDIAWATVSTGTPAVVFPSDWASPTNTYTASATWSKGSLNDDDYVWFFLLSSGEGGAETQAGKGGSVKLIYGKAGLFNGAAFVIGAQVSGTSANVSPIARNITTLTLDSSNGSSVFSTPTSDLETASNVIASPNAAVAGTYLNGSPAELYSFGAKTLPSGYEKMFSGETYGEDVVFGGARGQAPQYGSNATATSLLSGNGGTTASINGVSPGGGGAAGQNAGNTGGTGAAGNVRVYHV